jgi:chaperonin GroES
MQAAGEYRLNNFVLPGPLKCMGNQVLLKYIKAADQTAGGLFVSADAGAKPTDGIVMSAGPGKVDPKTGVLLPNPVKEGDLCVLAEFEGEKVQYNGENCIFVEGEKIIGCYESGKVSVATFRPIGERVMIEMPSAKQEETDSGIVLALDEDVDDNYGPVIAVGPGQTVGDGQQVPVGVSPGENVMYEREAGLQLMIEGRKFKIIKESDCLSKW